MKKFKKIDLNLPFLFKNFRNLSFEWKVIFLANVLTILSCVLPWVSVSGDRITTFFYSAFGGETRIIGILIFLLSSLSAYFFIDKIFGINKLTRLKQKYNNLSENYFFLVFASEQIIFLIIAWSVIKRISINYTIEFGFFIAFIAQVIQITASILAIKEEKHMKVKSFFNYPEVENFKQKHKIEENSVNSIN